MKLEIIEGCLNYSFTVDGDNIYNIDKKKLKQIALDIIDKLDRNDLYKEFANTIYIIGKMPDRDESYISDESCISTVELKDKLVKYVCNDKLEQTYIDSKPIENFKTDDIKDIWKEIISSYCSNEQILDILQDLVIDVGESKNLGHCTVCGDTTYSYVIKI